MFVVGFTENRRITRFSKSLVSTYESTECHTHKIYIIILTAVRT